MANDSLKIAIILSAVDRVSAVIKKVTDSGISKLNEFSKKTESMAYTANKIGQQTGALGLALAAPFGLAIKSAADYQRAQIALRTSFQGNVAAADKMFKVLNKFAADTPYELQEVLSGFVRLKNQGLDPSINALTAYGNTASAMGKNLNQMVEAVSDAATMEFERLKEFGIKANAKGKDIVFTFQNVKTHVAKNAKDIEAYLIGIGNKKFAGGIAAQAKSIYGQLSTLKDNATLVAVKIGNMLIPALNDLFKRLGPIIDRVSKWIDRNPQLTKTIMAIVGGLAALSLTISGISFLIGGLLGLASGLSKGFSALISIVKFLGTAFTFLGNVIRVVTAFMMANPILLIITAIAIAAFLIYKYWDQIKAFFIGLWGGIKAIFWKVIDWIKEFGKSLLSPVDIIIKYWDQIVDFFQNLWGKVKEKFNNFIDFVKSIPRRMYDAGVNIVKSIWEGIKSFANKPIEAIKGIVKKIRDFLPFSPAKEGPLRDIHRVRIIETIADTMKPGPMVKAMRLTTAAAMIAAAPISAGANPTRGGGGITVNYSPVYNISGASPKEAIDFRTEMQKHGKEIAKIVAEELRKQNRTNFKNG